MNRAQAYFCLIVFALAFSFILISWHEISMNRGDAASAANTGERKADRNLPFQADKTKNDDIPSLTITDAGRIEHKPPEDKNKKSRRRPSSVGFSPDGRFIIYSDSDIARFWRVSDLREQFSVPRLPCGPIWFMPDGKSFLVASSLHTLCLRNTEDGQIVKEFPPIREQIDSYAAFKLNGKRALLLGLKPHNICYLPPLHNPFTMISLCCIDDTKINERFVVVSFDDLVRGSLNPCGAEISADYDSSFSLSSPPIVHSSGRAVIRTDWGLNSGSRLRSIDLTTGKTGRTFLDRADDAFAFRFSENGESLACCESTLDLFRGENIGKCVRIFDCDSGSQLWAWHDGKDFRTPLIDVAFSPDNLTFATADAWAIRVRELATGRELFRLRINDDDIISSIAYSPDGERLAAATSDGSVWIWTLHSPSWTSVPHRLDEAAIAALWSQLAAADTGLDAYRAIWTLASSPETVVPFFDEQLVPVPNYSTERLRQLIAELDDDSFSRRESASQELTTAGIQAEPLLRHCLSTTRSPLVRHRVKSLLEKLESLKPRMVTDPSLLRSLRAVQVLQRIGNAEARAVLTKLAAGSPTARQTKEAKFALQHLSKIEKQ